MRDIFQQVRCDKGYARRDVTNKQARAKIKKFFRKSKKTLDKLKNL